MIFDGCCKKPEKHHHIEEVYTFSVHGLDKAMGLAPTRLAIVLLFIWLRRFNSCNHNDEFIMIQIGLKILEVNQVLVIFKKHACIRSNV
jgi:hypothetical protein